jgi:hypothetical protein
VILTISSLHYLFPILKITLRRRLPLTESSSSPADFLVLGVGTAIGIHQLFDAIADISTGGGGGGRASVKSTKRYSPPNIQPSQPMGQQHPIPVANGAATNNNNNNRASNKADSSSNAGLALF